MTSGGLSLLGLPLLLCLLLLLLVLVGEGGAVGHGGGGEREKRDVYVVYMGAVPDDSSVESVEETHLQLLSSVLQRGGNAEDTIIRRYKHGFSGFTARLTKEEATAISDKPGVVSVFVDPILQLHTTRSWEFLQQTSVEIDSTLDADERSSPSPSPSGGRADTIIGLLDTGIWPESKSFADDGFGPIPTRWKGTCIKGNDFNASNCNKKLIGARYYDLEGDPILDDDDQDYTPRDHQGHGTHTSSTAAGNAVPEASYYGLASGTAKGGSPTSRVAMYKVCGSFGCPGSALLSGFDDAVGDGVDLLSVSIGASAYFQPDFAADPIAIGAFHAAEKGITVVCSAGNDGPGPGTVVNAAPWILTVAATTIDRNFESDVVLGGNNKAVKGDAVNFSNLTKSAVYPLIYGGSAASNVSSTDASASHCEPGSLDGSKIKGKLVLCKHSRNDTLKLNKVDDLESSGAVGAILVNDLARSTATSYISFPVTEVSSEAADEILSYINSTKKPVATILPTITVSNYKPAPAVPYFSSRGPCQQTSNLLKPDIAAPGVTILASWIPVSGVPPGQKSSSSFNLESGTSMACPHVAGIAASVKAWNPTWSPSAIRSAIMTTATQANNDKSSITTESGAAATPYDFGAGEVSPTGALQPGLVYEAGTEDYLQFLCNYGYNASKIKLITTNIPSGFQCPKNSSQDLISNLNYPSIAVANFNGKESKTVTRVATNVGAEEETAYLVTVRSPPGLDVKVVPAKLQFTKTVKKLSYQVTFSASAASPKSGFFGSITWSDGTHRVRSPFVVQST